MPPSVLARCVAALLPGAAVVSHAVLFSQLLPGWLRLAWAAAGALVSLAWVADTVLAHRAGKAPVATLAMGRRIVVGGLGLGLLVFGHVVSERARHPVGGGDELIRVSRRGVTERVTTAAQLARESELKRGNIGLGLLLFGGLLLGAAVRESLAAKRAGARG